MLLWLIAALNRQPDMFSGDGINPKPGPMTCPFAIWRLQNAHTVQVTFSAPVDGEVRIRSVLYYPTP